MAPDATTATKPLKRLGFVQNSADYVLSYAVSAEQLYKRVRGAVVPASLEPKLSQAEHYAASVAAPLVARASDTAEKALILADDKVDYVVTTAEDSLATSKKAVSDGVTSVLQIHEANMKTFSETSKAYYTRVQHIADWAKDKLNPVKGGQAALDTLLAAIAKAKEATDPDVAAKMATDAWTSFASLPLVAKVLETADPMTQAALTSFNKLHSNLVGWTLYKRTWDLGESTLSWATTTPPYKLGAAYLYPWVQPVADPALDKLSHSKVVQETYNYWKPSPPTSPSVSPAPSTTGTKPAKVPKTVASAVKA